MSKTDKITLRLLLIEDSEFDALMVINVLRQSGFDPSFLRVETAEDMRNALSGAKWDLVISDYSMPSFSMMDALQILRSSNQDLPFIIVSGGIGEDIAIAAMKAGAHDYVMKGNLVRLGPAVTRELREATVREARHKAEKSLRESELRYRTLWETSTDAVIVFDEQYVVQMVNAAVEKIFGYTSIELLGKPLELFKWDKPQINNQPSGFLLVGPIPRKRLVETTGYRKDGASIDVEIVSNEIILHNHQWTVVFVRDISERKRNECVLRQNQEQFQAAREIQQQLFPSIMPQLPGFDLAGKSFPAEATGGDYFDFLPTLSPGLGIGIGDVTGHGLGPALLMAETRAYLRVLARNREELGDIVMRANRILSEDVSGDRYVTLFLAQLRVDTRTLAYVSAGHLPEYIFNSKGEVKQCLKRTGLVLGINPEAYYEASKEIQLESGDILVFVTDGLEETLSPQGEFFGVERIFEIIRKSRHLPAADIVNTLYSAGLKFAQANSLNDDFTAVVLKVNE